MIELRFMGEYLDRIDRFIDDFESYAERLTFWDDDLASLYDEVVVTRSSLNSIRGISNDG